jgi:ribose/xylose/arabinose/galactoside ABC-type transport system permease subunit
MLTERSDIAAAAAGSDVVTVEGSPAATPGPSTSHALARAVARGISRWAVLGGFVVMVVVFSVLMPDTFLEANTVKTILDQAAVPLLLVCGLTFVLAVGEFDLSYTATIGLAGGLVAVLMRDQGLGVAPAIAVTLLAALGVGVVVGLLVTVGRASSFIVTLAIGSALTGFELALTDNTTIYQGIPASFGDIASREVLGLHAPVWIAAVVFAAFIVLLHGTRFGRHAKAVGGNAKAAYLAGVRVRRVRVICFALLAVLAGVCAIVLTSRAASYYPNSASGFLLNTYAAAFLGAAAGRGGFTVAGSALGVLWLATLQTGLTLHNEPAWTSSVIQGFVLAGAVLLATGERQRST